MNQIKENGNKTAMTIRTNRKMEKRIKVQTLHLHQNLQLNKCPKINPKVNIQIKIKMIKRWTITLIAPKLYTCSLNNNELNNTRLINVFVFLENKLIFT